MNTSKLFAIFFYIYYKIQYLHIMYILYIYVTGNDVK